VAAPYLAISPGLNAGASLRDQLFCEFAHEGVSHVPRLSRETKTARCGRPVGLQITLRTQKASATLQSPAAYRLIASVQGECWRRREWAKSSNSAPVRSFVVHVSDGWHRTGDGGCGRYDLQQHVRADCCFNGPSRKFVALPQADVRTAAWPSTLPSHHVDTVPASHRPSND
jgi:hypothetical protein